MAFHVGQKVVCVDVDGLLVPGIEKGATYTVRGYRTDETIMVEEVPPFGGFDPEYPGYFASRFRPVVERKTDISIFTALLDPANHKHLEGV